MARRQGIDLLGASGGTVTGSGVEWPGGRGVATFECSNFNGGTVTLQMQGPNGTWLGMPTAVAATANGSAVFEAPNCMLRVAITVAVPAAAVFARVTGVPSNI